jgi:putative tryptophan/tyrosine transport system substrate-binding protein
MKPSRHILLAVVAVIAGSLLSGHKPAIAGSHFGEWFGYDEKATSAWKFAAVEGDPHQVVIHPEGKAPGESEKRIFVFYPRRSSAYNTAITSILNVFDEREIDAEFRIFNFRKDSERGKQGLAQATQWGAELIFSMGSESTAWLYKDYLGGDIPVVSVCSKDPVALGQVASYDEGSGSNFAFTSLNMPVESQMAYILELKPNLKNLGILVNNKNLSAVETQAKPISRFVQSYGIQVIDVGIENPEKAREELAVRVEKAVTQMRKSDPLLENSIFWITGSTAVFREIETINAHSDRVPVLSLVPDVVQAGDNSAVMAIGITFDSNAQLAAFYGIDVLTGQARVGDLKVGIVSPPDIAVSWRKAREIGMDVPFSFFESASFVYDYEGKLVRHRGKQVDNPI